MILGVLPAAHPCGYEQPERWYMLWYYDDNFSDNYEKEMSKFWEDYTGEIWVTHPMRVEAATAKKDKNMLAYLAELEKYEKIAESKRDLWSYPTKAELAQRKSTLNSILAKCKRHASGPYAERWALLEMRANMLLGNYNDNISFWENRGSKTPESCYKRMMRNIYANALLNTGKTAEAWNIYADQQDVESLIWSVRKYTNLAGIKKIYSKDPNAKVLEYLLQRYVNEIQDVVDFYDDLEEGETCEYHSIETAYAHISKDYLKEISDFADFAVKVANDGKTDDPGLWMTCAAIVDYYLKDYPAAKRNIELALEMKAPEAVKKSARRIRMLIEPEVADVDSKEFRSFMAGELKWLDNDIVKTENPRAMDARDRILNMGLAAHLLKKGDRFAAITAQRMRQENPLEKSAVNSFGYNGPSFDLLWNLSGDELVKYFNVAKSSDNDPLMTHFFDVIKYPADYVNDLIGTKYLAECNYEKALPYLEKVSQSFLNNQMISFYAAKRDYHIPAWYGYQSVGLNYEDGWEAPRELKSNMKVDFCKEMIDLEKKYNNATGDDRLDIAYQMATYLYQACEVGQCWFLTNYGASSPLIWRNNMYSNHVDTDYGESHRRAASLLAEASKSSRRQTCSLALFGLVEMAPDSWCDTKGYWDSAASKYVHVLTPRPDSEQFMRLLAFSIYMPYIGSLPPEVQRCDVLRQFRSHI